MKFPSKKRNLLIIACLVVLTTLGLSIAFRASIKDSSVLDSTIAHEDTFAPETYNVSFIVGTKRIETQTVNVGQSVIPPPTVPTEEGFVFSAWNAPLTNVRSDMLIRAELADIRDMENVFSLTSVYASQNGEATVPLRLEGDVNLCAFDIAIAYPKEDLAFVEFYELDEDVIANTSESDGMIYLNFSQAKNIKGGFDICALVFKRSSLSDAAQVPLTFSRVDVISALNDDLLLTKYNTIDASAFFY